MSESRSVVVWGLSEWVGYIRRAEVGCRWTRFLLWSRVEKPAEGAWSSFGIAA